MLLEVYHIDNILISFLSDNFTIYYHYYFYFYSFLQIDYSLLEVVKRSTSLLKYVIKITIL